MEIWRDDDELWHKKAFREIHTNFTLQHGSIGGVGDGKDMRWNLMTLDSLVSLHDFFSVDGKFLVRINDDTEEPWICL